MPLRRQRSASALIACTPLASMIGTSLIRTMNTLGGSKNWSSRLSSRLAAPKNSGPVIW